MAWEIWKEPNARVFHNLNAPTMVIVTKIDEETRLWALAGAKGISNASP